MGTCPARTLMDRREFLTRAAALGALGLEPAGAGARPERLYLSCRADRDDGHFVTGFDAAGRLCFDRLLPARGHSAAFRPGHRQAVVLARRPGTFALVLDSADGAPVRRFDAAPGRHFYGHGAYCAAGDLLFAAENDYDAGRGAIGVYDALDGYRRIAEWSSHGIGPHEIGFMPDGRTLAVANGGIRTHPDAGRAKLDVEHMRSNLAFIDSTDGRLLDAFDLGSRLRRLSIRHLDVAADGRVGVAMQYEGARGDRVPLVGQFDGTLRTWDPPAPVERRLHHYAGAAAFDATASVLAVSHPRGGLVTLWDARGGEFARTADLPDACGVAATGTAGAFIATGDGGRIVRIEAAGGAVTSVREHPGVRWDNHARALHG